MNARIAKEEAEKKLTEHAISTENTISDMRKTIVDLRWVMNFNVEFMVLKNDLPYMI